MMKEQQGHHTVSRTHQQNTASSPRISAHTTRTTSQRTHEAPHEALPASPHRAGFTAGLHPECSPYTSSEQSTRPPTSSSSTARRPASVPIEDVETLDDDDALYTQRMPSVVRHYWPVEEQGQGPRSQPQHTLRTMQRATPQMVVRYHHRQSVPPRSSRTATRTQEQTHTQTQTTPISEPVTHPAMAGKRHHRVHWLVYVGVALLAWVAVFIGVSTFLHWWQGYQDDLHYGRPRTFQCDARVGHHDTRTLSHFIALNLDKQIEVIEFPGGDATKAHVYVGPTLIGDGQDLTPVTLSFRDVTGNGKLDMLLHIGTQSTIVYLNDNGAFRPATANDHISL